MFEQSTKGPVYADFGKTSIKKRQESASKKVESDESSLHESIIIDAASSLAP